MLRAQIFDDSFVDEMSGEKEAMNTTQCQCKTPALCTKTNQSGLKRHERLIENEWQRLS